MDSVVIEAVKTQRDQRDSSWKYADKGELVIVAQRHHQ
jgi:hypothetical protein